MLITWAMLAMAVATEIAWGLSLKAISFYSLKVPFWTVPLILSLINMLLLAIVMHKLPAGLCYAVWTTLGTAGILIASAVIFGERLSTVQLIFIGVCVIGVLGLKLTS